MAKIELASQAGDMLVKAAPPLAVTGLTFFGVALPDIVGVATLLYLAIHTGYILNKWYKESKYVSRQTTE